MIQEAMYENYFANIGHYLSHLQRLTNVFQCWGYSPTMIPMLDEYEAYSSLDEALAKDAFRIVDPSGNLLLLRSDTTLFLARAMSTHLRDEALPLRLYYSNSIVSPSRELQEIELLQTGVELIGIESIAGDLEIISILATALEQLEVPAFRICIGSRKIIDALVEHHTLQHSERERKGIAAKIYHALGQREKGALVEYVGAACASLLLQINTATETTDYLQQLMQYIPRERRNTIEEYQSLISGLASALGEDAIRADLSEVGRHEYYTGTVFSIYMSEQPRAIAQGGRYDKLLQNFGVQASAIGGTIFPHMFFQHIIRTATADGAKSLTSLRQSPLASFDKNHAPPMVELVQSLQKAREKNTQNYHNDDKEQR